jgi:prepilin-type N-terminal cleavage/methylation domain-containing protein
MRSRNIASRGYSLVELIVVVAIIGVMSMVTIPAFMNYARANSLKSAFTAFTADIRNCRQRAISRNSQVRLELDSNNSYKFYEKPNAGTWAALKQFSGSGGPGGNTKFLDAGLTFSADTLGDSDSNSKHDILFQADGTVTTGTSGTITMLSPWKNIASNQYVITLTTAGKITSVGSHT